MLIRPHFQTQQHIMELSLIVIVMELCTLLTVEHGKKLAIIENEFGDVGIDDALLALLAPIPYITPRSTVRRANVGGAKCHAARRRAQKSVVVGSPRKRNAEITTNDARGETRQSESSQTEKTFKMGAVDVLFGADGTPRCA